NSTFPCGERNGSAKRSVWNSVSTRSMLRTIRIFSCPATASGRPASASLGRRLSRETFNLDSSSTSNSRKFMAPNLSRRFFLTGFGAVAGTVEACSTGLRRSGTDRRVPSGPWKWDTVLWDRDGWTAAPLQKFHHVDDGRLVVRIRSRAEQAYANDV